MHKLLLAAIVVAVALLAWWWWFTDPPPESSFTAQAPDDIWTSDSAKAFTCDNTLAPGWCVVPTADAARVCLSDSKCVGYLVPGADSAKIQWPAIKGAAQLVYSTPSSSKYWRGTTFFTKN